MRAGVRESGLVGGRSFRLIHRFRSHRVGAAAVLAGHPDVAVVLDHGLERADLDDARVVDEHVDRSEVVLDTRDELEHVVAIGDPDRAADRAA